MTEAAKAVAYPFRVKSRFQAFIRPAARVAGAIGVAMLVACGALAATPADGWPAALDPGRLPVYAMISVAVASLLGWTFVNDGQNRIERRIGRSASLVAFVVLPIAFAIAGFVGAARAEPIGGPGRGHWFWSVVHWYGPVLVVASLASFLSWKSRGRSGRGILFALLVAPYAALLAYLVFGLTVPGIDEAHHATLGALGSWAIALQLALSFFVGGD